MSTKIDKKISYYQNSYFGAWAIFLALVGWVAGNLRSEGGLVWVAIGCASAAMFTAVYYKTLLWTEIQSLPESDNDTN